MKLKPLLAITFLLCIFFTNAQHQVAPLLRTRQLETFIATEQQSSGALIEGFYHSTNLRLETTNYSSTTFQQYNYKPEEAFGTNLRFFIDFNTLGDEDTLFIYGNTDSIALTQKNLKTIRYTSLPYQNAHLQLKDYPPYQNHNIVLKGIGQSLLKENSLAKNNNFGDSGDCQVNINCSEGDDYQDLKRAVVRILWKINNTLGWCTGTLVNNTSYNYRQFLLTAEHCAIQNGNFASADDFTDWTFYFNFESSGCPTSGSEQGLNNQTVTGATLLANSDDDGGSSGSDFLLLEINPEIPASYNPYFSGWNRSADATPQEVVCIHHPNGDIKKISTNSGNIGLGTFSDSLPNLNSHYLLSFSQTENGYGTTEAGSSGSGIFDENHLLRGTLTGGFSGCSNTSGFDYFGTMPYHWNKNGTSPQNRLMDWLDSNNTGALVTIGTNQGDPIPQDTASFAIKGNPVINGSINIAAIGNLEDRISLQLFDLKGQLVRNKNVVAVPFFDTTLDVANLRNGLYILRINTNGNYKSYRVVIANK